jgi:PadR family transcriptional regulator PadR
MSRGDMSKQKSDVPYGTLDLFILRTLDTMGPLHGYNIARRIEQAGGGTMRLSQGAISPALIRLEQQGWVRTVWGISDTNRKVKIYQLTRGGRRHLREEIAS